VRREHSPLEDAVYFIDGLNLYEELSYMHHITSPDLCQCNKAHEKVAKDKMDIILDSIDSLEYEDDHSNLAKQCQHCSEEDLNILLKFASEIPRFDRYGLDIFSIDRYKPYTFGEIQGNYSSWYEPLMKRISDLDTAFIKIDEVEVQCAQCIRGMKEDFANEKKMVLKMLQIMKERGVISPCFFCPVEDQQSFNSFKNEFYNNQQLGKPYPRESLVSQYNKARAMPTDCIFCLQPEHFLAQVEDELINSYSPSETCDQICMDKIHINATAIRLQAKVDRIDQLTMSELLDFSATLSNLETRYSKSQEKGCVCDDADLPAFNFELIWDVLTRAMDQHTSTASPELTLCYELCNLQDQITAQDSVNLKESIDSIVGKYPNDRESLYACKCGNMSVLDVFKSIQGLNVSCYFCPTSVQEEFQSYKEYVIKHEPYVSDMIMDFEPSYPEVIENWPQRYPECFECLRPEKVLEIIEFKYKNQTQTLPPNFCDSSCSEEDSKYQAIMKTLESIRFRPEFEFIITYDTYENMVNEFNDWLVRNKYHKLPYGGCICLAQQIELEPSRNGEMKESCLKCQEKEIFLNITRKIPDASYSDESTNPRTFNESQMLDYLSSLNTAIAELASRDLPCQPCAAEIKKDFKFQLIHADNMIPPEWCTKICEDENNKLQAVNDQLKNLKKFLSRSKFEFLIMTQKYNEIAIEFNNRADGNQSNVQNVVCNCPPQKVPLAPLPLFSSNIEAACSSCQEKEVLLSITKKMDDNSDNYLESLNTAIAELESGDLPCQPCADEIRRDIEYQRKGIIEFIEFPNRPKSTPLSNPPAPLP
jgi:hypothetical protein